MPQRPLTLAERYVHWMLLGAAGLCALVMLATYGVRSPHRVVYRDQVLTARELDAAIGANAEELRSRMEQVAVSKPVVPDYSGILAAGHAAGVVGERLGTGTAVLATLPRSAAFGQPIPKLDVSDARGVRVVPPLGPTDVALSSGRSVVRAVDGPAARDTGTVVAAEARETPARAVSWVCVAGRFDLSAQRAAYVAAGYPAFRAQVYVAGVEAQRQRRLPNGQFGDWGDVQAVGGYSAAVLPEPIVSAEGGALLNQAELIEALRYVKRAQVQLRQPRFHEVVAGAEWRGPFGETARGSDGVEATGDSGAVTVWAHDDNAEPGQTYRYRLRVMLWNRYAGRPELLEDPTQAAHSVVPGTWSAPSAPIHVAPDVHFLASGVRPNGKTAGVEVLKWHMGQWVRATFDVGVGDEIGAPHSVTIGKGEDGKPLKEVVDFRTGVVVLDVRGEEAVTLRVPALASGPCKYEEATTTVVTYVDPHDGEIRQRVAAVDRYDPLRRQAPGP